MVLERSETLRASGAAIAILTNGWRALDQLGIGPKLRSTALPLQGYTLSIEQICDFCANYKPNIALFLWLICLAFAYILHNLWKQITRYMAKKQQATSRTRLVSKIYRSLLVLRTFSSFSFFQVLWFLTQKYPLD